MERQSHTHVHMRTAGQDHNTHAPVTTLPAVGTERNLLKTREKQAAHKQKDERGKP